MFTHASALILYLQSIGIPGGITSYTLHRVIIQYFYYHLLISLLSIQQPHTQAATVVRSSV